MATHVKDLLDGHALITARRIVAGWCGGVRMSWSVNDVEKLNGRSIECDECLMLCWREWKSFRTELFVNVCQPDCCGRWRLWNVDELDKLAPTGPVVVSVNSN